MYKKSGLTFSDEEIGEMLGNPIKKQKLLENVTTEDRYLYTDDFGFNWLQYEVDKLGLKTTDADVKSGYNLAIMIVVIISLIGLFTITLMILFPNAITFGIPLGGYP